MRISLLTLCYRLKLSYRLYGCNLKPIFSANCHFTMSIHLSFNSLAFLTPPPFFLGRSSHLIRCLSPLYQFIDIFLLLSSDFSLSLSCYLSHSLLFPPFLSIFFSIFQGLLTTDKVWYHGAPHPVQCIRRWKLAYRFSVLSPNPIGW